MCTNVNQTITILFDGASHSYFAITHLYLAITSKRHDVCAGRLHRGCCASKFLSALLSKRTCDKRI